MKLTFDDVYTLTFAAHSNLGMLAQLVPALENESNFRHAQARLREILEGLAPLPPEPVAAVIPPISACL